MKVKAKVSVQVIPVPNRDERYMIQMQFTEGGLVFTKDNMGMGYWLELAQSIADMARTHPESAERHFAGGSK